jgi:hypothetical protein
MAWNHRTRVVAMAVAIQAVSGTFVQPNTTTDLLAVSAPTNTVEAITTDDPTATGAVWDSNRVYLGKTATIGATLPLRGPGGAAPPAANAWVPGRILQAGGWAEIRKATASSAVTVAGSTTTAVNLATTESTVDDFLLGAPLQTAAIGTGFQQTTIIRDYVGSTRVALLAETLGAAPATGVNYTIPAYLGYVLGTITTATPNLSVSIWRDKKRYDYRDWNPASIALNIPVANEANQAFPDLTFSGKGIPVAVVDDVTPVLPSSIISLPIPPARNGKFFLDRVKLGHQSVSFTVSTTVAAASNQNQAAGQDGYDIIGGSRQTAIDLNQMNVTDFDIGTREDVQTIMPLMSTWGMGSGNNFGFVQPNIVVDPFSPGDRNGYVNLSGNAYATDVDKSAALAIWW